ncbi:unnamed protein product [Psylliodes chrysocephalus]|uniref:C-type lectin domain-containing protein n=1 Tax=Psylliodes chrysocephalus TaxID=3402493 RepID=A0A9P0CV04_9CUCU|nr:unnamed protein product [Psylliodes chrysocephala]
MHSLLAISCVFICLATSFAFHVKNDTPYTFKQGEKEFLLNPQKMTFSEANDYCKSVNLELAAIESAAEDDKIFYALSYLGLFPAPKAFWTAGTKLASTNKWVWLTTNKVIGYFNWGDGEPSNKDGNEFCIATHPDNYYSTGYWTATDCNSLAFPICQTVSQN